MSFSFISQTITTNFSPQNARNGACVFRSQPVVLQFDRDLSDFIDFDARRFDGSVVKANHPTRPKDRA